MKFKQVQTGSVMVLTAISMLVVVAIAGAGIDLGHTFVNKTRAQNLVDALALAGAKSLDETNGNTVVSGAKIEELYDLNMLHAANTELNQRLVIGDVVVQYSETLRPFVPGGADPRYIRVVIYNIPLQSWFIQLLGIDNRDIAVSAISGPSSNVVDVICDSVPVMVCGDPSLPPVDPETLVPTDDFWGYKFGHVQMLKGGSATETENCIGPGNFQLIDIGEGHGANTVRDLMAGGLEGCESVEDGIPTEPGNTVGPTIQGLNTRFNEYLGPMNGTEDIYPPDVLTSLLHQANNIPALGANECQGGLASELNYSYEGNPEIPFSSYLSNINSFAPGDLDNPPPYGAYERRVLRVPVGNCTADSYNGKSNVEFLGEACFFLLKQIDTVGGHDSVIFGEFIENCTQDGKLGPEPGSGPGSYKIILYEDMASLDS